jgi:hypothetical protein
MQIAEPEGLFVFQVPFAPEQKPARFREPFSWSVGICCSIKLQFFEGYLELSTLHLIKFPGSAECVAQLLLGGAQSLIGQRRQYRRAGFPVGEE